MITEANIDKKQLKSLLEDRFNIKIKDLIFQPKGEVSWSYKITCKDNIQYFLKIHKNKNLPIKRLELLYDLYSKCNIKKISYPIKTSDNKLEIIVDNYPAVLFNFINGITSKEQRLSHTDLENLGDLLSKIHNSRSIIGEYGVREEFKHPFKPGISRIYEEIESIHNLNRYQQDTKKIYLRYKSIFINELQSLEDLSEQLRVRNLEFVNCHGEPSPDNILISKDGQIYLIDWDEPIFAPKEKDLMFFIDRLNPIMAGYKKGSIDTELDKDVLRYYQLLWNVQEIEDWGTRIFFEEHPLNEYKYYLKQLKHFLDYSGLDKKIYK